MKTILLACLFLAGIVNAKAQSSSDATVANVTKGNMSNSGASASVIKNVDPFNATSVSVKNKMIHFKNLPEAESITAYLTNSAGEIYMERQISNDNSSLDISDYPGTGLHYVTLITNDKKKKVFIVHL